VSLSSGSYVPWAPYWEGIGKLCFWFSPPGVSANWKLRLSAPYREGIGKLCFWSSPSGASPKWKLRPLGAMLRRCRFSPSGVCYVKATFLELYIYYLVDAELTVETKSKISRQRKGFVGLDVLPESRWRHCRGAAAVRRRQVSIAPLPPTCRGQCEQSHVMT
jgi:hypothetical protein